MERPRVVNCVKTGGRRTLSTLHLGRRTVRQGLLQAGLGTAFFSVRYVPFFSVLFSSFWRLMRPKRTQRMQRTFAKNIKEGKERKVLLQRT